MSLYNHKLCLVEIDFRSISLKLTLLYIYIRKPSGFVWFLRNLSGFQESKLVEMQGIWMSVKENVSCGTKESIEIVSLTKKCSKDQKNYTSGERNSDKDKTHQVEVLFRPNHPKTQLHSEFFHPVLLHI